VLLQDASRHRYGIIARLQHFATQRNAFQVTNPDSAVREKRVDGLCNFASEGRL
jgi:hypothetical protein